MNTERASHGLEEESAVAHPDTGKHGSDRNGHKRKHEPDTHDSQSESPYQDGPHGHGESERHEHHHDHGDKGDGATRHLVEVEVDSATHRIQPGSYVVSAFKEKIGVDADRLLDEVTGPGKFVALDDNQTIHICGGEVFVSYVKKGQSS